MKTKNDVNLIYGSVVDFYDKDFDLSLLSRPVLLNFQSINHHTHGISLVRVKAFYFH